jgi:hypothetical protein
MGCEITNVESARYGILPSVTSSSSTLSVAVASARHGGLPAVDSGGVKAETFVESLRIGILPKVTSSIVCDVGVGEFVKWALESLQWLGEDNQVGVTKFNTLIASGEWSLEELEIEELL